MTTKDYIEIRVYWDESGDEPGWTWKTVDSQDQCESGIVNCQPAASLSDAVDQACYQLDAQYCGRELDHNDFGMDEKADGGWAIWGV